MTSRNFIYPTMMLTRENLDDRICIEGASQSYTWKDLLCRIEGYRLAFVASNHKRIAIYFDELIDSAAALLGCWAAGCTAVLPADTSQTTCDKLCEGIVDAACGSFSAMIRVPRIIAAPSQTPCRAVLQEDLEQIEIFTSGSTGTPVRIIKRLRQLFCEVQSIEERKHGVARNLAEDALVVSTVSQQHIYGLLFFLLWSLASARPAWERRVQYPESLISIFSSHKNCIWIASPAHLKRLPEHLPWENVRSHIAGVYSSGGPLDEQALIRTIQLTGQSPVELLGSSESGGIAWRSRIMMDDGSITNDHWQALPAVEWREENGLLVIRSPQLSSADWETTSDKIRTLTAGKTFMHLGRADRIAKIEEKRVSLTLIENSLTTCGLLSQARALQLDDKRHSLAIVGVPTPEAVEIIATQGKRALVQRLRTELLQTLERVCLPRHWRFCITLPENCMGKTTREALLRLFETKTVQAVARSITPCHAELVMTVSANCPYFSGHFPGFSILPGLAQIQWIIELAQQCFRFDNTFLGLKKLKFSRPIRPASTVLITLNWDAGKRNLNFEISSTEGVVQAKGDVLF